MGTTDLNYRSLPISERIELVEDIWDSIAEETSCPLSMSTEERAELHRRYAAHLANPSSSLPWERVRAALTFVIQSGGGTREHVSDKELRP
jgi:putative addiction module component (TIGR02574 family)